MTRKRLQKALAWTGPAFCLTYLIGWVPLAHFLPAVSPSASAAEVVELYTGNLTGIRLGCLLMLLGLPLLAPWGGLIAARTARFEPHFPIFASIQLACVGACTAIVVLIPVCWGLAAFRPEADPEITRMLNDAGWFMLLVTYPPFSVWCVSIAIPILANPNGSLMMPRWVAFVNLWAAVGYFPAGIALFFHEGAFAYNGFLALYVALGIFFVWMFSTTFGLMSGIARDELHSVPAMAEPALMK